ncbi:hypothetical protein G9U51_15990 [Calidifontibacter sp. DB0510]|uniref:DUF2269 family protein n=1 Tax=Metallococcus carri TaxID=1656884 RepID=A0A967EAB0_9MICO|nr:hypothetical protein [Metallococcus carri]NHN57272.1 hypothetical protein [Metallococcus carri]NOP38123.1 hypothetical protein [Calidifontibacter sp. DB2511S]
MYKLLLTLHLVAVIFSIGPLVHFATTAARGLRRGDAFETKAASRSAKLYSLVSLLAVVFGFGLVSAKSPYTGKPVASMSDLWVLASLALWVVAVAIVIAVIVPCLDKATVMIGKGASPSALTGRVAAAGGVVALLFIAVVALMVYQP